MHLNNYCVYYGVVEEKKISNNLENSLKKAFRRGISVSIEIS